MDLLERVKLEQRISGNRLDDLIEHHIETARAELIRAGVSLDFANETLVDDAVVMFCCSRLEKDLNAVNRYDEAFKYQLDCLRKSGF